MADLPVKPTRSESLLIWRRREELNQVEAAAVFKVHPDKYRDWEAGRGGPNTPVKTVGTLEAHEICLLLRRRAGITQKELAKKIGCTRLWVLRMEIGDVAIDRLTQYWGI